MLQARHLFDLLFFWLAVAVWAATIIYVIILVCGIDQDVVAGMHSLPSSALPCLP